MPPAWPASLQNPDEEVRLSPIQDIQTPALALERASEDTENVDVRARRFLRMADAPPSPR
jgi:hypothetical protein